MIPKLLCIPKYDYHDIIKISFQDIILGTLHSTMAFQNLIEKYKKSVPTSRI